MSNKEVRLFDLPDFGELEDMVGITITNPPPSTCSVGWEYTLEGNSKLFDKIATPPWVYAQVRLKKWYQSELLEEVDYVRGVPNPLTGDFSIDLKFSEEGDYEITALISPAPVPLPLIGVIPVLAQSDTMAVEVTDEVPEGVDFSIGEPTASPETAKPGTKVTISSTITSNCNEQQTVTVKCLIYEGALIGRGDLIQTLTSEAFNIDPTESYKVDYQHTAVSRDDKRRDVEIQVYIGTIMVASDDWDDTFEVSDDAQEVPDTELSNLVLSVTEGTYAKGASVPLSYSFDYVGKAQTYTFDLILGTGVYPLFITRYDDWPSAGPFNAPLAYSETEVGGTGSFTVPDELELGETYNARIKVTMADGEKEQDTRYNVFTVEGGGTGPGDNPPDVTTKSAKNVTHEAATLVGRLNDTGYDSRVNVYFEYGKTSSYGKTTSKKRMYSSEEGDEFDADIEDLDPDTKYHYRAAADSYDTPEAGTGYGSDRTFTTEEEEVVGFKMRVINAPSKANYWACAFDGGGVAEHSGYISIDDTWDYEGDVPSTTVDMTVQCYEGQGGAALKSIRWQNVFRLYAGSSYVIDFDDSTISEE